MLTEAELRVRDWVSSKHKQIVSEHNKLTKPGAENRQKQMKAVQRYMEFMEVANKTLKDWETLQHELAQTNVLQKQIEQAQLSIKNAVNHAEALDKEYFRLKEQRNKQLLRAAAEEGNKLVHAQKIALDREFEMALAAKRRSATLPSPSIDQEALLDELFEKDLQEYNKLKKAEKEKAEQKTQRSRLESVDISFRTKDLDSFFDDEPTGNEDISPQSHPSVDDSPDMKKQAKSPEDEDDDWD